MSRYTETRNQAAEDWWEAAKKLLASPEKLVAGMAASFPAPGDMERAFGFATQLFQIAIPDGMGLNPVTAKEQMAVMQARSEAARQAAAQISQGVEGFVADCVASLREQTANLCQEMLASMRDGKTGVHQKTLNRLTKFIDEFRSLNFVGDRQLEEQLDRMRQEFLGKPAEEYRNSDYARQRLEQGLVGLADTARELARQDSRELVEQFGQMGVRKFHMVA